MPPLRMRASPWLCTMPPRLSRLPLASASASPLSMPPVLPAPVLASDWPWVSTRIPCADCNRPPALFRTPLSALSVPRVLAMAPPPLSSEPSRVSTSTLAPSTVPLALPSPAAATRTSPPPCSVPPAFSIRPWVSASSLPSVETIRPASRLTSLPALTARSSALTSLPPRLSTASRTMAVNGPAALTVPPRLMSAPAWSASAPLPAKAPSVLSSRSVTMKWLASVPAADTVPRALSRDLARRSTAPLPAIVPSRLSIAPRTVSSSGWPPLATSEPLAVVSVPVLTVMALARVVAPVRSVVSPFRLNAPWLAIVAFSPRSVWAWMSRRPSPTSRMPPSELRRAPARMSRSALLASVPPLPLSNIPATSMRLAWLPPAKSLPPRLSNDSAARSIRAAVSVALRWSPSPRRRVAAPAVAVSPPAPLNAPALTCRPPSPAWVMWPSVLTNWPASRVRRFALLARVPSLLSSCPLTLMWVSASSLCWKMPARLEKSCALRATGPASCIRPAPLLSWPAAMRASATLNSPSRLPRSPPLTSSRRAPRWPPSLLRPALAVTSISPPARMRPPSLSSADAMFSTPLASGATPAPGWPPSPVPSPGAPLPVPPAFPSASPPVALPLPVLPPLPGVAPVSAAASPIRPPSRLLNRAACSAMSCVPVCSMAPPRFFSDWALASIRRALSVPLLLSMFFGVLTASSRPALTVPALARPPLASMRVSVLACIVPLFSRRPSAVTTN
ncbi:Uncharacterised protein [Achromobacter ruhlandii]|nr:Uncharacterised protein [Achromobacter ruhlandii]CUJ96406.1 Uncharacterised protein [Achromobacter ruhlandii]